LAGTRIQIAELIEMSGRLALDRFWVIEGAGGLLVPINEQEMMADLIKAIGLPVVVAARSGLGTINHTLLTVEALRRRDITIAGVITVGEPNIENRRRSIDYGAKA
jgi:dethiobiotin synthase